LARGFLADQSFTPPHPISYLGVKLPRVSAGLGALRPAARGRFAAGGPVMMLSMRTFPAPERLHLITGKDGHRVEPAAGRTAVKPALRSGQFAGPTLALLGFSRIVPRIDVVDAARSNGLNLDYGLLISRPGVMSMVRRIEEVGAGFQQRALLRVELVTLAQVNAAADYRHALGAGMSVGGNLIVGRELGARHVHFPGFRRVAD